jgi:hypothetical protein
MTWRSLLLLIRTALGAADSKNLPRCGDRRTAIAQDHCSIKIAALARENDMVQQANGKFDVKVEREAPFDESNGLPMARTRCDKTFHGDLDASSVVHMLSVGTSVPGSAAYVAVEKISGTLHGRRGSFALAHLGVMDRGAVKLELALVPDSGTSELAGLRGEFRIEIKDGQHLYFFEYALASTT